MRNDQIGLFLRKYRKQNQLTIQDVIVELSDKYGVQVAEKTIYGWESNQAHPTSDVFIALCDIYKVNSISEAFPDGNDTKGFPITPDERELIERYRQNPTLQLAIRRILEMQ